MRAIVAGLTLLFSSIAGLDRGAGLGQGTTLTVYATYGRRIALLGPSNANPDLKLIYRVASGRLYDQVRSELPDADLVFSSAVAAGVGQPWTGPAL